MRKVIPLLLVLAGLALLAAGAYGHLWPGLQAATSRLVGCDQPQAVAWICGIGAWPVWSSPLWAKAAAHILTVLPMLADPAGDMAKLLAGGLIATGILWALLAQSLASLANRRRLRQSVPESGPTTLSAMTRADREFLPAALEILETPLSPVRMAFLWFICLATAGALAWSYFGKLDIHAVAQGRVQPIGRSKVVQPFEPGKIVKVLVENGSHVEAGDVLLELDPTETVADRDANRREHAAMLAEAVRRRTAVAWAQNVEADRPTMDFPPDIDGALRQREELTLGAELDRLEKSVAALEAQREETAATIERLSSTIESRARVVQLSRERVDMREKMQESGSGSRAQVVEALQAYEKEVTQLTYEQGQLLEAEASIKTLEARVGGERSQFVAEQAEKLADAERRADQLAQQIVKAEKKSERTTLRAPISGTVQQLAVTTFGQVVTTGQSLMTLVPDEGGIEIEAMILNQDIGFVEPGQRTVVKVDAFPFTRYGTLTGRVVKVSRDGVDETEAGKLADAQSLAERSRAGSGSPANSSARARSLVFPASIRLDNDAMLIDGRKTSLRPGMAVTVEIRTGERRAIDYLLSPLREATSRIGSER